MAATAVGSALLRSPVPAGSTSHWRATGGALQAQPLLSVVLSGLQTLGLIQVPATHLGIAGQVL